MSLSFFHGSATNCKKGREATYIQRQIQAKHITLLQQSLKRNILCAVLVLWTKPVAIMVANLHAKRARLDSYVASDATHAENTEDFPLRVVAECGKRAAAKLGLAECFHGDGQVAQRAEEKEDGYVGGCVVDGCGGVGDVDGVCCAGFDVDLVVSGA